MSLTAHRRPGVSSHIPWHASFYLWALGSPPCTSKFVSCVQRNPRCKSYEDRLMFYCSCHRCHPSSSSVICILCIVYLSGRPADAIWIIVVYPRRYHSPSTDDSHISISISTSSTTKPYVHIRLRTKCRTLSWKSDNPHLLSHRPSAFNFQSVTAQRFNPRTLHFPAAIRPTATGWGLDYAPCSFTVG